MNSNSSAYEGTVEFEFVKSKQWQGKFDVFLAIKILCGAMIFAAPYIFFKLL